MSFAKGIDTDRTAVDAALRLKWSNGPVEGHVHRVKLLKRLGFGRASLARDGASDREITTLVGLNRRTVHR